MDKQYIKRVGIVGSIISLVVGIFFIMEILGPEILYRINKPDEKAMVESIKQYEKHEPQVENTNSEIKEPKYTQNRLIIPKIGVDLEISPETQLLDSGKGGWVQELNKENNPLFIAVHRFGWETITPDEKMKQTLYHVYKLEQGDKVIVLWNGGKYEYEVKDIFEGNNNPITKENELVLYTCKFLSSPERVFVILDQYK